MIHDPLFWYGISLISLGAFLAGMSIVSLWRRK